MNDFPHFDSLQLASVQLGSFNLNKITIGQRSNQIKPGVGYRVSQTPGGTTVSVVKRRSRGGSSAVTTCPFGEIYTYMVGETLTTGIRGGVMLCGENNFNISALDLDLGTDGEWLAQIKLNGISMATDDDEEIFLPGGVTGATGTPDWDLKVWTDPTDYDDNTNPATPAATGEIVIPLGRLSIVDGVASIDPVACGRIVVGACGGIFSHSRG